jgi:hypothetical protein
MMKKMLTILALTFCFASGMANPVKPVKTVDLRSFHPEASECDGKWIVSPNRVLWMDNEHLVAWLTSYCASHDRRKIRFINELVFIDSTGLAKALQQADMSLISRGPGDSVLVQQGTTIDLMSPDLQIQQSIRCPDDKPCGVYPSPSGSSESDFAICSIVSSSEHCGFYRGLPAVRVSERTLDLAGRFLTSPYPHTAATDGAANSQTAWRVAPFSSEPWAPSNSNCTGESSAIGPPRFLVTCVGAHIFTDGEFDSIFGYSRIALFDVTSRRILARIDGPAYTWAALSPNGKQIASIHKGTTISVKLYRVE